VTWDGCVRPDACYARPVAGLPEHVDAYYPEYRALLRRQGEGGVRHAQPAQRRGLAHVVPR
jgi:hypothetical protein